MESLTGYLLECWVTVRLLGALLACEATVLAIGLVVAIRWLYQSQNERSREG